jgi:hypothetical protein
MTRHFLQNVAHATLVFMLVTFLSPMLGWAMVASHEELAHAAAVLADREPERDHFGAADHDHGLPPDHDHTDPHSFIGHLFSHMPFQLATGFELLRRESTAMRLAMTADHITSASVEPLFRPPLGLSRKQS